MKASVIVALVVSLGALLLGGYALTHGGTARVDLPGLLKVEVEPGEQAALKYFAEALIAPVGTLLAYSGRIAFDCGAVDWETWMWAPAFGCEAPIDSEVCKVVGDNWGKAAQAEHCKLPDLRGEFIRGADERPNGRVPGSNEEDLVGGHAHTGIIRESGYTHNPKAPGDPAGKLQYVIKHTDEGLVETATTGTGIGAETRPHNRAVHWIVKIR